MAVAWDDDRIFKFIELFAAERCLWDTSSKDYKNRCRRNDSWESIANVLEIPRRDLENKMHILRSQFTRERKRIFATNTIGTADTEKCKWKFYDPLKFLANVTSVKTYNGGFEAPIKTRNQSELQETDNSSESSVMPSFSPPRFQLLDPLQDTLIEKSIRKAKKRKIGDNLTDIIQIVQSTQRMYETKDEFDIYGQYVASELRSVKDGNAVLQAKAHINTILINLRMGKNDYNHGFQTHGHESTASSSSRDIAEPVLQITEEP